MTDADLLGRLEAHARLHDGYCEHVPQDAFVLNRRTGKPFDEIVDDLKPFLRLNVAVKPRRQASA